MSRVKILRAAAVLRDLSKRASGGVWNSHDFGLPGMEEPMSIVIHTDEFDWRSIREDGDYLFMTPNWDRQESDNVDYVTKMQPETGLLFADMLMLVRCPYMCDNDGYYWPYCSACEDSTYDHDCPEKEPCKHDNTFNIALEIAKRILGKSFDRY